MKKILPIILLVIFGLLASYASRIITNKIDLLRDKRISHTGNIVKNEETVLSGNSMTGEKNSGNSQTATGNIGEYIGSNVTGKNITEDQEVSKGTLQAIKISDLGIELSLISNKKITLNTSDSFRRNPNTDATIVCGNGQKGKYYYGTLSLEGAILVGTNSKSCLDDYTPRYENNQPTNFLKTIQSPVGSIDIGIGCNTGGLRFIASIHGKFKEGIDNIVLILQASDKLTETIKKDNNICTDRSEQEKQKYSSYISGELKGFEEILMSIK